MTTKRLESCDDVYRRACVMLGMGWPSPGAHTEMKDFTSRVFSVSEETLDADIASEMKKRGKPVVGYLMKAAAASASPQPTQPAVCKVCGGDLTGGRCRFVNHKR
jgi:hypothetical protein